MEKIVIGVGGMSCQGCVKNVSGVLAALPGVASVEVSLESAQASIAYDPQTVTVDAFRAAIEDAGFDVA
jgi:copper chaperone